MHQMLFPRVKCHNIKLTLVAPTFSFPNLYISTNKIAVELIPLCNKVFKMVTSHNI